MKQHKRKQRLTDEMLRDVWNIKPFDTSEDILKDFERLICSAVSRVLADDKENRETIAEYLSLVLGEEITRFSLDAWSSPAREDHRVSAARFLALIAITRRYDVLDAILREIDAKALDRQQSQIFEVGLSYIRSIRAEKELTTSVSQVLG